MEKTIQNQIDKCKKESFNKKMKFWEENLYVNDKKVEELTQIHHEHFQKEARKLRESYLLGMNKLLEEYFLEIVVFDAKCNYFPLTIEDQKSNYNRVHNWDYICNIEKFKKNDKKENN